MKRKMIISIIIVLFIAFILGGCANIKGQANTQTPSYDNSSESTDFTMWNGTWNMKEKDTNGSNSSLVITDASEKQFSFSISAVFANTFINEKGEEVVNAHTGEIDGIAYYVSASEAYFITEDEPEYKMVFRMTKDNIITIEEINVNTGQDFGYSPMAGLNVRYFGEYAK